MGQTLTHGVYLPDEGERNCYSGLAANWQILDSSVGTIAAHTAALSGKAPLVHTHTKSDITDFPAYGNTAGTICEGNDSRLSDARTPVSHTHGNITNDGKMTNGNRAVITGSDKSVTESSVTDTELGYLSGVTSAIQTQLNVKATDSDVVHKSGNETVGGNKTWTGVNNITNSDFNFSQNFILGDGSSHLNRLQFYDSVATRWGVFAYRHNTDNSTEAQMGLYAFKSDNTITSQFITFRLANNGDAEFRPFYADKKISLGTSTNKWKTLNGVNPGALSLPDMGTTADVNYFDFISSITPLDGTDIFYRPPVDGWMTIIIAGTALALFEDASSSNPHVQGSGATAAPVKGYCEATIPVHKNVRVKINAIGTSVYMAQVRPCLGNV